MTSPSFSQIRARAESLYKPDAPQRIIGIRLAVPLRVAELGEVKGRKCHFNWCDSPLEIRELLVAREADESLQVVLTDLDEQDLGQDLLARFVKRRLFPDDAWQTLQEHFRARHTDPTLKKHRWLAAMLIEAMPPGGYAPVASGVLDAETVWGIVLKEQFGFAGARPDARDLLAWTIYPDNLARYTAALPEFKLELRPWLRQSAGELSGAILDCLDAGWGETAVSIGLACQVVFSETADATIQSELHRAAARMEQYIGNRTLKPSEADAWRNAAESLIDRWFEDEASRPTARRALERADRLLADLKIPDLAWLGQHSPSGFDQALERYGEALRAFCREGTFAEVPRGLPPGLLALAKTIFQHKQSLAGDSAARVEAVEMSLRLLRWLGQEPSEAKNFEEAARAYAMEGGFVDRARYALYRGDAAPALSDAYTQLVNLVTARREAENRRFAELMVKWIEAGARGKDVVKIENVLEQVVAEIAGSRPVLLIVMDGMGYAVFSELLEKITERGWVEIAPESRAWPAPVIAALPSITRVSRASLLCGKLTQGGSAEERAGFASNEALGEALRKVSKASAPVLFHKNNLNAPDEPGDMELSADWRQALASENQRVVGVVVNAVDDHLDKGDQLNLAWNVETIVLLDHLLYAARDAGRTVVITSDHGHIIERQTVYREPLDPASMGASGASVGERYRGPEGVPAADEMLARGRRVLPGRIIAPWSEQVRYTKSKKHGYHGGLTPQECVVPGCVLVWYDPKGDYGLEGWKERERRQPAWWSRQDQPPPAIINDRVAQSRKSGKKPAKEMPLFAGAEAGAGDWLDRLFESDVFASQYKLAGRGAPKLEDVRRFLDVLAPRGGKALKLTMAQQLGHPELRIAGLVASMRRILNVDGYAVLDVEESSSTICLDIELLNLQFGLDENDD